MKVMLSLLGMVILMGTAGCHNDSYRGGSYEDYPPGYYGQDRYDRRNDHGFGQYDQYGRYYGRNYRPLPEHYGPYDRDNYWYREGYRRP